MLRLKKEQKKERKRVCQKAKVKHPMPEREARRILTVRRTQPGKKIHSTLV
jgi:hypothetical protein